VVSDQWRSRLHRRREFTKQKPLLGVQGHPRCQNAVAKLSEHIFQFGEPMFEGKIATAIRASDRVDVRFVEDVDRRLAPTVFSAPVEDPNVRLLEGRRVWVAPSLKVALRNEVLVFVFHQTTRPRLSAAIVPMWIAPR
jgi:hypothetical protein